MQLIKLLWGLNEIMAMTVLSKALEKWHILAIVVIHLIFDKPPNNSFLLHENKKQTKNNMLSRFVIAFLPGSKHLLISWLQSLSAVILEPKKIKSVTVSIFSPSICHEVMGLDAIILVFWMLSLNLFCLYISKLYLFDGELWGLRL